MRFEIKTGGTILILAGLVGLSGAVFALGLVAGYEMERQVQPDINQISTTYPVPSPPEKPAPVSDMSSSAVPSPAIAEAPPPAPIKPPAPAIGEMSPAAHASPAAVARAKPPAMAPAANPPSAEDEDTDEDTDTAAAAPPAPMPPPHSLPAGARPYNIQIEAVMDKSGADEMVSRLKSLGYNAQETSILLGGQTWYRVHVGPFASADEATAAQNRLREQYKQAYSTSH
jgi:septal ring-binding cell division protein DamX